MLRGLSNPIFGDWYSLWLIHLSFGVLRWYFKQILLGLCDVLLIQARYVSNTGLFIQLTHLTALPEMLLSLVICCVIWQSDFFIQNYEQAHAKALTVWKFFRKLKAYYNSRIFMYWIPQNLERNRILQCVAKVQKVQVKVRKGM